MVTVQNSTKKLRIGLGGHAQAFILTSTWSRCRVTKGIKEINMITEHISTVTSFMPSGHPSATCLFCQITSRLDGTGKRLGTS